MDIISIAEAIEKKIREIDEIRKVIFERGETKAKAIAEYECKIAVVLMELKNGKAMELGGERIENPPVTIMEKIVKGLCWEEKLKMELAESSYKSAIINIEAVCAQLNAFQSLNRYLDKGDLNA
jgi:hypothetical protein